LENVPEASCTLYGTNFIVVQLHCHLQYRLLVCESRDKQRKWVGYWWTPHKKPKHNVIRVFTGRIPFDQNFRKFRFKIKWIGKLPEIRFENFGSPFEVVLFSGNLEIPEISCSICHFYPVWIGPNSFSREKLQDGGESFESYNTGCKMICHSSSLFLIENENVRTLFPGQLWTCRSEFPVGQFARFAYSPVRKARKFLS